MINHEHEENNSPNGDTRKRGIKESSVVEKKHSEIPPPHRLQTIKGSALIDYNNSLSGVISRSHRGFKSSRNLMEQHIVSIRAEYYV